MKKIILILLLFVSVNSFSQNKSDTLRIDNISNYKFLQVGDKVYKVKVDLELIPEIKFSESYYHLDINDASLINTIEFDTLMPNKNISHLTKKINGSYRTGKRK